MVKNYETFINESRTGLGKIDRDLHPVENVETHVYYIGNDGKMVEKGYMDSPLWEPSVRRKYPDNELRHLMNCIDEFGNPKRGYGKQVREVTDCISNMIAMMNRGGCENVYVNVTTVAPSKNLGGNRTGEYAGIHINIMKINPNTKEEKLEDWYIMWADVK